MSMRGVAIVGDIYSVSGLTKGDMKIMGIEGNLKTIKTRKSETVKIA